MRRLLSFLMASTMLTGILSAQTVQTKLETTDLTNTYKYSTSSLVAKGIHDPSVVWDSPTQTFYVYGSHYAGAKTTDLRHWTAISEYYKGGYDSANAYKAFQSNPTHTVKRCLPGKTEAEEVTLGSYDAGAFAGTYAEIQVGDRKPTTKEAWVDGCQWAPDIVYNPSMGKWCYYLSINGDYWASVIVLMTSNSPTGPFTYEAPIVFGGFDGQTRSGKSVNYKDTDLELVLGTQSSLPGRYKTNKWGNFWPNCIDPCVFFDEEGEMWMSYGSWSGGIWMLKLDKQTGLRDYTYTYSGTASSISSQQTSDAYFGKLIAGGAYVSGEGSYIQHIGNYYYLFMSYGAFGPIDGYEMRIFRSENPDGPYVDANGINAINTTYQLNYGPNAATNKGMKIIGSYNGWGPQIMGQCAMGHNSACQDDQGRTYVVFHSKFANGETQYPPHAMRVHQLFLNKSGWLCAAPFAFNGEETTDATIATTQPWSATDIEGDYHVLIHPYKLDHANWAVATPKTIHLSADGKVTGDYTGTWTYTDEGKSYFRIKLGTVTYDGVVTEQTIQGSNNSFGLNVATAKALCFSAVCTTKGNASCGVPVWGYKMQAPYAIAYNYQTYSDYFKTTLLSRVSKNIEIVFTPEESVELEWTSSNPDVLSNTGKCNPADEDVALTMTARLSAGSYYWEKEYSTTVKAATEVTGDPITGLVAYYNFDERPTQNLYNPEQTVVYGRSSTSGASAATQVEDPARFGKVVRQYFGAQGYNSYSRMTNPLYEQENLDGFTVSLWVKRADDNKYDALWSFFDSTSPKASGARLFLTGNSYLGFNDDNGNWFDINYPEANDTHPSGKWKSLSKIGVGAWHLVTITYSKDSGYMFYLDGSTYLSSQMVYAGSAATAADFDRQLVLNHVTTARYFFLGLGSFWGSAEADFDDLMIYNRALTADDVKGLSTLLNRVNHFDDGTIVGIDGLSADTPSTSAAPAGIYDLTGRKVTHPGKGLYIVDGKKVWFQ